MLCLQRARGSCCTDVLLFAQKAHASESGTQTQRARGWAAARIAQWRKFGAKTARVPHAVRGAQQLNGLNKGTLVSMSAVCRRRITTKRQSSASKQGGQKSTKFGPAPPSLSLSSVAFFVFLLYGWRDCLQTCGLQILRVARLSTRPQHKRPFFLRAIVRLLAAVFRYTSL